MIVGCFLLVEDEDTTEVTLSHMRGFSSGGKMMVLAGLFEAPISGLGPKDACDTYKE